MADICLKYANLETIVGEIDRARAIYTHGSQYSDPRARADYWKKWHDFEVRHGNEDTFAEMMRIKRSVAAQYSTISLGLDTSVPAGVTDVIASAGSKRPLDEMQALEREKERERERSSKRSRPDGPTVAIPPPPPPPASLIHEEERGEREREGEGEGEEEEAELEQLAVPKAVFGGLVGK